tara:strand:+ start:47483 stop:48661 length:1179 start_codon:yes stop_codon:yes gene_type:complete
MVKFNDLTAQWHEIKDAALPRINTMFENSAYVNGPEVQRFEKNFAKWNGNKHCIGVSSGLDALRVATQALRYTEHVHIYTQANTYIATVLGPDQALNGNCTIHLIDHDQYFQLDTEKLLNKLTTNTEKFCDDHHLIIPVHLYGHPCDMETIMKYAQSFGCDVLEDCSQAHGAKCNGKQVGTFGDIAAFSCYPGKNLGAAGQAGVITTDDDTLAERCNEIKEVGSKVKYVHNIKGGNYRLDPIQAIVLDEKLKHLDLWNANRRKFADNYSYINNPEISVPLLEPAPWCTEQVFHIFPILVGDGEVDRQELMNYMQEQGSQVGIHYPICIEETGAYSDLGKTNHNPRTRGNADRLVSLPIHPFMSSSDTEQVVHILNQWVSDKKLAQEAGAFKE